MKRTCIALASLLLSLTLGAQEVKVTFYTPGIVRIQKSDAATLATAKKSFSVVAEPEDVKFSESGSADKTYSSSLIKEIGRAHV